MTDTVNEPREARYGDETASQIVRRWAAWIIDASADMEQPEWGGKTDNDVKNERDFLIRSLLAAAPKAEPHLGFLVETDNGTEWVADDPRMSGAPEYYDNLRPFTLEEAKSALLAAWEVAQPEAPKAEPVNETSVVPCPQCEGEGEYADGLDEAACATTCTRCKGNGWIVDLTTQPEAPKVAQEPVMVPEVFWSWLVERGLAPDDPDFDWNDIVEILNEHENELIHPVPASDDLLDALEGVRKALIPCGVLNDSVRKALTIADRAIAQHKGPQS